MLGRNEIREMVAKLLSPLLIIFCASCCSQQKGEVSLTLIPPTSITNKVKLDIRAGIHNNKESSIELMVQLYLNEETAKNLLVETAMKIAPNTSECLKYLMPTDSCSGLNTIILVVEDGKSQQKLSKSIEIIDSGIRSTKTIDGAFVGLYHWSEEEGKLWNNDLKKLTDKQWREIIRSMHSLNMNIVVVQEVFRNQEYVGKHAISADGYRGKAFYPSKLFPDRMPIAAENPIEAILSEADKLNMHVFLGVGLYAWFDFSTASLEWHKRVARELLDMYGHHNSFYGFYVSEESGGSLDNWEADEKMRLKRKEEIVSFFRDFKLFCNQLAPAKPIMLATNSMGIPLGQDTYPELLKYLDILCPFGFARMPEGDLTGEQAANLLQDLCNTAGAHLWFDLEAFLFNKDGSLYPRPIQQIVNDLTLLNNFEKTICYQYPGVFSDPAASFQVGEPSTRQLFRDYQEYLKSLIGSAKKNKQPKGTQ
jgi:hypothetical protein